MSISKRAEDVKSTRNTGDRTLCHRAAQKGPSTCRWPHRESVSTPEQAGYPFSRPPVLPFSRSPSNDPSRRPGRGAGRTHRARMPGLPPQIENRKSENEKGPRSEAGASKDPGNDLLSHTVSHAVSSALEGLTAVFGMGTGVAPPPRSPESRQNSLRPNHRRGISRPVVRPKEQSGVPGKPLGFAGMAISRSSLTTD